jgi:hypothetical protein
MITVRTNLKGMASTQYLDHNYNSMVNFNGVKLGAMETGIYQMDQGDDDDGVDILAYFEPGTTDFGINNPKRLRFLFLGFESTGDLEVDISADQQVVRTVTVKANKLNQQRTRVAVGRDGRGRYWSFRIRNKRGCDFSMDSMDAEIITLNQGLI